MRSYAGISDMDTNIDGVVTFENIMLFITRSRDENVWSIRWITGGIQKMV
jgi:hypothetical protein